MATRSVIAIETDGKIVSAYCHWDGYLENNGEILFRHYQNPEKILKLISFGDMSSLGEQPEPVEGVEHTYTNPAKGVTVYYGRDRGEDDTESRTWNDRKSMIEHHWDCEYFYLWTGDHWIYSQGRAWFDLRQAIDSIEAENAE